MADGVAADQPRRVLLKLSGEAFGGGKVGIDTQVIRRIAEEIVPPCGRAFRSPSSSAEATLPRRGIAAGRHRPSRGDYMGMLGTVMNCPRCRISWSRRAGHLRTDGHHGPGRRAVHSAQGHPPLEKGRVVIFGAGAGMPYFSTDSRPSSVRWRFAMRSLRGAERRRRRLHFRPRKDADAKRFATLSYNRALCRQPGGHGCRRAVHGPRQQEDASACSVSKRRQRDRALLGEEIGTLVSTAESTSVSDAHR